MRGRGARGLAVPHGRLLERDERPAEFREDRHSPLLLRVCGAGGAALVKRKTFDWVKYGAEVRDALVQVKGIGMVTVNMTFDPPWTPDRMSEEARLELNMF